MTESYVKAESSIKGLETKTLPKAYKTEAKSGSKTAWPGVKPSSKNRQFQSQCQKPDGLLCWRCAMPCTVEHNPNTCHFKGTECFKCKEKGHIAAACQHGIPQNGGTKAKVKTAESLGEDSDSDSQEDPAKLAAARAIAAARSNGVFAGSLSVVAKSQD